MDRQEKAVEERQTSNAQDLSFRKQTHKQKHELTKMQPQPQGPIAASTVHRQCISPAGHRHRPTSTAIDAALPGAELLSVSSRNHALADRQCDPSRSNLHLHYNCHRRCGQQWSPEPQCAQTRPRPGACRGIDCQGASRGCLRQHGLPPTPAHFSPLQPTPASSNPLRARSRLATPTAIPTACLQLAPLLAVVTLSLSPTVHTSLPHTAPH
jgi:hypothetical protein